MDGLAEFFAMGGYARFVWTAYLIAAAVLAGLLGSSLRGLRRNENALKTLRAERRGAPTDEVAQ